MSFSIRKIGMLKMPKIAMLSTKPTSFPIRKIGMLEMPKIAMLSTPSLYIQEGFGKVLGKGIEPGCIAGCKDEADHE